VLKTEMDAGHGGASGRFDRLKETALCFAFAVATIEGRFKAAAREREIA
jgi:oligopeptidase B